MREAFCWVMKYKVGIDGRVCQAILECNSFGRESKSLLVKDVDGFIIECRGIDGTNALVENSASLPVARDIFNATLQIEQGQGDANI